MNLNSLRHIYFLGLGGIGMSSIARYFNRRGVRISGYDKTPSPLTDALRNEGMQIHFEDRPQDLPEGIDLVVYTPAIPATHGEFRMLMNSGIPMHKRSEVLARITESHYNVAVAGTHGKTTTSALLAHLLVSSGIPTTAFLGGICLNYDSNFIDTGNQVMVEEADEYDRSFLQLRPDIGIVGSLDADHLDIYGSRRAMLDAYACFAQAVRGHGPLLLSDGIAAADRTQLSAGCPAILNVEDFGLDAGAHRARILGTSPRLTAFEYISKIYHIKDLTLALPGQHNVRNATAAIAVALQLGADPEQIRRALASFRGIQRRLQWRLDTPAKVLIDDYAHHPEELRAVIRACREMYPQRKLTGIFQPHLYTRTRDFMDEFARVLESLDQVVLVELYPARELPLPGIDSGTLFEKIRHSAKWLTDLEHLPGLMRNMDLDVVMTLGAGDLDTRIGEMVEVMNEQITRSNRDLDSIK
ncbi:MAG: UDP-N-acetylmuramate--L-alanine ligase [Saprospiraceae bacterium]|nr:UDP-N-acetylmuramate--L-alanine ligase [Saprospiraceae bacterium]